MNDRNLGVATIIVAVLAVLTIATMTPIAVARRAMPSVGHWVDLTHDRVGVSLGDPVYQIGNGRPVQVGYVEFADLGSVKLHLDVVKDTSTRFEFHRTTGSLAEATALLLPPKKRREVETLFAIWAKDNGRRTVAAMIPIIERAIAGSVGVIERGVRESLQRHEPEVDAVASKFKSDVVNQQLIPLAQSRLMPIIRTHADEPARLIGRELWDRASVWGFAWRAVLDTSRLPREDLVAKEWSRFVDEEAIVVLEQNSELIAATISEIIIDTAADQQIRDGLGRAASTMVNDPATRRLVQTVLRESVAENRELRRVWSDALTSPEALAIFDRAGQELEPIVRRIGDTILGTADGGISEGLTRVLRNQVLGRDRRWIMMVPGDAKDATGQSSNRTSRLVLSNDNRILPPVHLVGQ